MADRPEDRSLNGLKQIQNGRPAAQPAEPWANEAQVAKSRRVDLVSLVPLMAIVALVAMVTALIWAVNRSEVEQVRVKTATDALWVEQTLRFQLGVDEDTLVRLALDAAARVPPQDLDARARLHITTNPEVLAVIWYGPDAGRLRAMPGLKASGDPEPVALLQRSGAAVSRPVYGRVMPDASVTLAMPVSGGGFVSMTISLPLMLERHIPWWIAEQYAVHLTDAGGEILVSRARLDPDDAAPSHAISFDPPLSGTFLRITGYDPPTDFSVLMLYGAVTGLAGFAMLALYSLYGSAIRRRTAELRLRGETAFRRSMEESLTVGLRAKDHEGHILYVNSAFCNLVGWSADELVGSSPPMPYWDIDRIAETEERHRQLQAGGAVSQSFETRFRHRDGHTIEVQVFEAPLIDARGAHRGWMGSVIDITEAKRAARMARLQDETMARTGRLVTLGEMASTLAHELNQPLSAIASYAAGMRNMIEAGRDPESLKPAMEKLAVQAGRAGLIIRRIQDLVKKREPRFSRLALEDVLAETVGFLESDAREHRVQIVTMVSAVAPVQADRILLEQVLINLIRNGMEAMADPRRGEGRLTLRLFEDDGLVVVDVEDQGSGIDPAIEGRLFDAFSSTKPQGMGMGLNICRSIMELHRGQLTYRAGPGGGTIFRMALPAADDEQEEKAEE